MALDRRGFLQAIVAGAATLAGLSGASAQNAPGAVTFAQLTLPRRTLGKTGIRASLLGMGTGTIGAGGASNQTRMGKREFVGLLQYGYERGVTYFDLADQYGSHPFMREALRENGGTIPRERVMLLTKSTARTAEQMDRDLERFRQEVGTEYFDVVLLHCLTAGNWTETHAGAMEALSRAREKGIVRAHGVSCHSLPALRRAADEPWVEVNLARYNPWNRHMDADKETVAEVLAKMKEAGKGVIGMKILAQGDNTSPHDLELGVGTAMLAPFLDMFTIGFETREQLDEVLAIIARAKD